jgi:catechol 2,3-dioxygenase-like lactoylglutathione lyase family enzyme
MPSKIVIALAAWAATAAWAQNGDVLGAGNFTHIVSNLDKSAAFYRDVLGMELSGPVPDYGSLPEIMRLGNTPGAHNRMVVAKIPGSTLGVELIEYKDIARKPANPRFQDPGAGNLALRVRDIDTLATKLKASGAAILTRAGQPVSAVPTSRNIFVQDPDGFVVELAQSVPPPDGTTNLTGASVEFTVADVEKTAKFFQDQLGFPLQTNDGYTNNKLMADTARTPGAQFRQSRGQIPGSNVRITFIEFKDIDRKPLHTNLQDPGTALLQLRVRDADELTRKLKAAGAEVISTGGTPVSIGKARIAVLRGPDNLFLELIGIGQ